MIHDFTSFSPRSLDSVAYLIAHRRYKREREGGRGGEAEGEEEGKEKARDKIHAARDKIYTSKMYHQ